MLLQHRVDPGRDKTGDDDFQNNAHLAPESVYFLDNIPKYQGSHPLGYKKIPEAFFQDHVVSQQCFNIETETDRSY